MHIGLEGPVADAFGQKLAEFWRRHYRLEDRERPGWVSLAELKRAVHDCEFEGGIGNDVDSPTILRNSPSPVITEFAELAFLWWVMGIEGENWTFVSRATVHDEAAGTDIDILRVTLPDGAQVQFCFDVTGQGLGRVTSDK